MIVLKKAGRIDIDKHNLYSVLKSQGNGECVLVISHFNNVVVLSIVNYGLKLWQRLQESYAARFHWYSVCDLISAECLKTWDAKILTALGLV